jgi:hypothetical protein
MHANHPEMAKRWEQETPKKKLPARKGKLPRVSYQPKGEQKNANQNK